MRGSHQWNRPLAKPYFEQERLGGIRAAQPRDAMPVPDFDGVDRDRFELIGWAMEPGDIVVFHGMTVHGGSGRLPAAMERRSISAQVVWRGRATRQPAKRSRSPLAPRIRKIRARSGRLSGMRRCVLQSPWTCNKTSLGRDRLSAPSLQRLSVVRPPSGRRSARSRRRSATRFPPRAAIRNVNAVSSGPAERGNCREMDDLPHGLPGTSSFLLHLIDNGPRNASDSWFWDCQKKTLVFA